MRALLEDAQTLAGLLSKRGPGWHRWVRKLPRTSGTGLKVLCELGGRESAQTVLQCYQQADEVRLRQALKERRRAR